MQTLTVAFLMNKTPMELFKAGGPIMWPMLFLSLVALTVVIERLIFIAREKKRQKKQDVRNILQTVAAGDIPSAIEYGRKSTDFRAQIMAEALEHKDGSMEEAFSKASTYHIARYLQGLAVMDTAITAAPLLGLLGTVTGMMNSFGAVSGELGAPTAITGGIAEALVATACGLFIAVTSLMPYNYLNTRVEEMRREIDEVGSSLEMTLKRLEGGLLAPAPLAESDEAETDA